MNKKDKLSYQWNKKENDFVTNYPLGIGTNCDSALLFNVFCYLDCGHGKNILKELESRGYDLTTIKFSIEPRLPNIGKFKTLTEKYNGN